MDIWNARSKESSQLTSILSRARREAQQMQDKLIRPHHILIAIVDHNSGFAAAYLSARGLTSERIRELLQPLDELRQKKKDMLSNHLATTIGEIYCRTFTTPKLSRAAQQVIDAAHEKQAALNLSQLNADLFTQALLSSRHSSLTMHLLRCANIDPAAFQRLLAASIAQFAQVLQPPQKRTS